MQGSVSSHFSRVEIVWSAYQSHGHEEYHGEAVSQLQHAAQAALLARAARPDDPAFILAAFLHDYGHIAAADNPASENMNGYGTMSHEQLGATMLRQLGFSEEVTRLVAGHVDAKRYLVSTDPAYYEALSEASKITLAYQGGRMNADDMRVFENDPLFEQHIRLRRIDESAKNEAEPLPDLLWLKDLMLSHLSQNKPV